MGMTIDSASGTANNSSEDAKSVKASSELISRGETTVTDLSVKVTLSAQTSWVVDDGLQHLYSRAELVKKAAEQNAGMPSSRGGALPPPDVAAFEAQASLPRSDLYAMYEKAVASLNFQTQAALDRANAEVPKSDDPARLAQAEKATAYVVGKGPSPFPSLSRNELAAIYYDYSGRYTSNERLAAAGQMNEMDKQFWAPLLSSASTTGDSRAVMEASIAAYDAALPIEKMKSPANYKQLVQRDLDYANRQEKGPIDEKKKESLLEMLNALYQKQKKTNDADTAPSADHVKSWSSVWAELAQESKESAFADNVK